MVFPSSVLAKNDSGKPTIFFYHDGRHPLIYMYEPPMQKEEYEAAVDELAGTSVEAIMFCLGDGRTVLHDTKVGELWGHHNKVWEHTIFRRAYQNAKVLIDQGHDPLRIICDRAHEKGLLVYPTLLVNQNTGERGVDMRTSLFRLNHPHLEIGAGGGLPEDFPAPRNLDFKHKEVREERLALIRETLMRYDIDGFELQMNYVPYYFRPDELDAGRGILSDWIEEVYRAVKESGPERELAVRVPASLEACDAVGMDVREWIRRGVVDVVTGGNLFFPAVVDQALDLKPLVAAARGTRTRVLGAIYAEVHSDRRMNATTEMIRAGACNYWAQGVNGLLLDQWFGFWPYQSEFYENLREIPHPDIMSPKDKSYFLLTETEREAPARIDVGLVRPLPRPLTVDRPVKVEWSVSDDLTRWQKAGRVHRVLLRVRLTDGTETDQVSFTLNGKRLPESLLRKINHVYKMRSPRYRVFGYWYVFELDSGHWPVQGTNELEVTLTHRDQDLGRPLAVRDVELDIKYLLGRNFHRRDDVELGPSESSNY
ncbi:MAG: hypothetical protein CMJ81_02975 [Planctomycetaceae bacterium]|nr:hypothetical protein [Planctomycetaceae bacterium]